MRDSTVFDDGVRLTSLIQLRVPPDFRERMQAAAAAERLTLTEFARRAIAERMVNGPADRPSDAITQTIREPDAPRPIAPDSSVPAAS